MIETVEGAVLRSENLEESDRRVTLYTKQLGKVTARVTGVRKNGSKLRIFTIPFIESRFQIYLAGSKRFGVRIPGKIIGGEIIFFHSPLRNEWDRMIQCSTLCEIFDQLTPPFYPNLKEYELLIASLNQMEISPSPLAVCLRSTLILLKILGYSLRHHSVWKSCSEKEKKLLEELAKWDACQEKFSDEEIKKLEKIVNPYLNLYLSSPLKTAIFQQKIEMEKLSKKLSQIGK